MTIIDKIEKDKDTGIVSIRFIKDDGGYHRTTISPDADVDKQLKLVNDHLVSMGRKPFLDITEIVRLKRIVNDVRKVFGANNEASD